MKGDRRLSIESKGGDELEHEENNENEPFLGKGYPIMLYDGRCLFCNAAVQFVLRFESHPLLRFAALQSLGGMRTLSKAGLRLNPRDVDSFGSFVIIDERGKAFTKMGASLQMFRCLGGGWAISGAILSRIIPTFLGDFIYSLGWKYRGFILGKSDKCVLPTKALKDRTIDEGDQFPYDQ